ncbi:MAG: hypothetical protein SH850_02540, partial [Planctomycetaceae bacterium]|nr:hypothetical protein [Planctomycetaceae bacterium]
MPASQLQPQRWTAAAVCDAVTRTSLLAATILLPWSFGGVDAFSQYLMFVFLVVAEAAFVLRLLLAGSTAAIIPSAAIPAAAIVVCGFLQTLDLGQNAIATLSPQAAVLRSQLLDDGEPLPGGTENDEPRVHTLSLYAPATRKETALLLAGLAVLLLAAQVFAQPREVLWLASALAINGAAIAYLGIMQKLSWNGQIYWSVPTEGNTPFGPFVNRNGGGGYLVLCLTGTI